MCLHRNQCLAVSAAMDLRSVGCVLMDLLLGQPLLVCRDKHSLCGAMHCPFRDVLAEPRCTHKRVERDTWSNDHDHFVQLVASLLVLNPAMWLEWVQDNTSACRRTVAQKQQQHPPNGVPQGLLNNNHII